jgi:RNA polymerase-binding protein DksA
MKKKTKISKPAKKTVAKKAVKKTVAKKAAVKPAPKKSAAKPVKKVVAKKPAAKAIAKKTTSKKPVVKAAAKPAKKTAAAGQKAASAKAAPKPTAKKTTAKPVVTTVLPPKLSNARVASSATPASAAVKAPKAPQAKLAAAPAPASTKKRLNKEELKFFENLLNEKKETLLQEQSYLEDNALRLNSKDGAGDLSSHAYHLADHATETQDREQAFHLASREGKFLFYIEEALDRVRAGTFGICKKCGVLIPHARLVAVPTAKMCINCKSMQEHAVVEDAA